MTRVPRAPDRNGTTATSSALWLLASAWVQGLAPFVAMSTITSAYGGRQRAKSSSEEPLQPQAAPAMSTISSAYGGSQLLRQALAAEVQQQRHMCSTWRTLVFADFVQGSFYVNNIAGLFRSFALRCHC